MLKLVGALLIMAGAGWWGLQSSSALRDRARVLEELQTGTAYLTGELSFRLAPVPELLDHLGGNARSAAGRFFQGAAAGLRTDPEGGLYQSWRRALVGELPMLRSEERQVLLELGRTLGRYDVDTQTDALARASERLEGFRQEARAEAGRLGKVYAAVSLAGGAAVVLVLL